MVKKFLVFLFLVFSFLSGYSQFPATQFMGNPNTLVKSKGAFGSDSGYVYIYSFSDTLAANSGYLKNIAGITIRVVDTLFQRSNNLQKWVRVGTGSGATIAEPSNQIVFGSGSGITSSPNYLYFNSGTESNVEFNNPNNGFNVLNTYVISDSVSNQFNDANGNTIYLYQANNDTISYVYYNPIASVFLDENKIFEISGNALKNDATIYSHRSDTSGLRLFNLRSSSPTQSGGAIGVDDSGYVVRIANGGVNIYNSDGTQSDAIRTYDGDGGELSFSNLGKFKVSASDSAIIKSSNIYGTATNSFVIDSIGGMQLRKYGPDAVVTIVLDENNAILNSENIDDTSTLIVAHNGISMISSNYISLTADSIVITQTPPTLTTDYDVLVRDENTGKVGIATISGGISAFVSDTLRAASTSGVNIKNSLGNTAAIFGASNTTTTELLGRVKIKKDSVDIVSDKKYALVIDTTTNEIGRIDIDAMCNIDIFTRIAQKMGSANKAYTIPYTMGTQSGSLSDGQINFTPIYLKKGSYTGFKWTQVTQGNYVADNYNGIVLYSYIGGTLTLVDSTTRDGDIWKAASGAMSSKAFNAPINIAEDDVFYVALIYNASSQTTAPIITRLPDVSGINLDLTNSAKLSGTISSVSTPSNTYAMSSVSQNVSKYYFVAMY